jgi:hypothetical protein
MKHLVRAWLVILFCAASVAAQTSDAAGSWDVHLNAPDGPHDASLTLTKAGDALSGAIKGPEGEYQVQGTQNGTDVSLSFTYHGDSPILITMKGTIKGDAMSGPATFGDAAGDWTGKRAVAAASAAASSSSSATDISGGWAFEVNSPAGTGTPTMTFNQSGEKLSGTYVGQLGEAPLQGTLKDGQISFSIDVTVQDTHLHIVYSGTVSKDGMKGTVSFGDLGEGTFTARRK